MSEHDGAEELEEWGDDALVRALRAPGSAAELAREQEYVGAYRDAGPPPAPVPLRRRSLRRLGTGGTAVAVVVALSGGVAAAYTSNLPDPVQQLAHDVIGAPAPLREAPEAAPATGESDDPPAEPDASAPPSGPATAEPSPTVDADDEPGTDEPGAADPSGSPDAGASTATTPSASPSGSPSGPSGNSGAPDGDAPAPVTAAAVRIGGGAHLAAYASTVRLTGQVASASGAPVPGRRAVLQVRRTDGWAVVAQTTTDRGGRVGADSAPVTGRAAYRWRVRGAISRVWQVRVRATVSASADVGQQQTTVAATAVGGAAGDRVLLATRVAGETRVVARASLGGDGRASFTFRTPARQRTFAVVLARTVDHTAARTRVVVEPPAPRPEPPDEAEPATP